MEFGKLIVEARERMGMTQREVAEALGVTASSVSVWEGGRSTPGIEMRAKLAEILDVPAESLMPETRNTAARVVVASEQDLISIIDCVRRLPPHTRKSLTLTVQLLANVADFAPEPAQTAGR